MSNDLRPAELADLFEQPLDWVWDAADLGLPHQRVEGDLLVPQGALWEWERYGNAEPYRIAGGFESGGDEGWVYFVQGVDGGPVKIGWTAQEPRRRFASLQVWSPVRLCAIAVVRACAADERRLHYRFRRGRLHGEWFDPSTPGLIAPWGAAVPVDGGAVDPERAAAPVYVCECCLRGLPLG